MATQMTDEYTRVFPSPSGDYFFNVSTTQFERDALHYFFPSPYGDYLI